MGGKGPHLRFRYKVEDRQLLWLWLPPQPGLGVRVRPIAAVPQSWTHCLYPLLLASYHLYHPAAAYCELQL